MDKMRQDFEDAYEQKYGSRPRLWDDRMNAYRDAHSNVAYWGWKAATLKAFGDGHRAGFESGMKAAHPFEPAASMQDDSPRMMAIGQNGNTAESYGKGCKRKLKEGQWFAYCGETDMGQTLPALCTCCGGEYELAP